MNSIISVSTLFVGGAKESSSVEKTKASDYKMVLMLPGSINDQSWNATNYSGLAGIIASFVTKNRNIATVGGFPNKAMIDLLDVYEAASYAMENSGLEVNAARAYSNSWSDLALGKQKAETMIDNGADTLFFYANQVGLGAIQAAKEKGAKFVGLTGRNE